jgi:HD-GYP domain-containing protein (c-di-GMP phosphodiesterase class II)
MRFVPINCIKEGSYLAKTIYDNEGRVLLARDIQLTNGLLKRVQQIGILSLYINDEYSQNEIDDIIKPEIKQKAVSTIKSAFESFQKHSESLIRNSRNVSEKLSQAKKHENLNAAIEAAKQILNDLTGQKNVMINLVDVKSMDNYTYQHSVNVAVLSLILGIHLNLNRYEMYDLCIGAMLHDIGKVLVPKEIVQKKGQLTPQEFEIIKEHTVRGYEYIKNSPELSATARIIVLQHHEKVNGLGYPENRKSSDIYKLSKIVAIADVYDALTSDRPYRLAMSPSEALEFIMANGGTHFDYEMVRVFAKIIVPYPEGTLVRLSTNDVAVVEKTNIEFPLRPMVRIVRSEYNVNIGKTIDLFKELDKVITAIQYSI